MRRRLRNEHSPERLAEIYGEGYEYTTDDHWLRIAATSNLINWAAEWLKCNSIADLSCGDGAIVLGVEKEFDQYFFNDFARTNAEKIIEKLGDKIDKTIVYNGDILEALGFMQNVDLLVCSETLEHLNDPDLVLREFAKKTKYLVLSTPDGRYDDENEEHYWAWDKADIKDMLINSGFEGVTVQTIDFVGNFYYNFQLWLAKVKEE